MKHYAISRGDGSVSIMHVVPQVGVDDLGPAIAYPSIADELAKWSDDENDVVGVREISADEVPQDRTFRDAWTDDGSLSVDLDRAREIHRDNLRRLRAPLLTRLDVEYQRADEAGDGPRKRQVAAQKQALRDVTADPAIDAARTPDELEAILPAILSG
jgi:hypothetical protein